MEYFHEKKFPVHLCNSLSLIQKTESRGISQNVNIKRELLQNPTYTFVLLSYTFQTSTISTYKPYYGRHIKCRLKFFLPSLNTKADKGGKGIFLSLKVIDKLLVHHHSLKNSVVLYQYWFNN